MGAATQCFSYVVAEFSDVGSCFASYFEEYVSFVHFEEGVVVYFSCSESSFYGSSYGRALIDGSAEFV